MIGALQEGIAHGRINEDIIKVEAMEGFLSDYGHMFYRLSRSPRSERSHIVLETSGEKIPDAVRSGNGSIEVAPFRRGNGILSLSRGERQSDNPFCVSIPSSKLHRKNRSTGKEKNHRDLENVFPPVT